MRARTIREGSVGLLILIGVAMFGGLVLWLRGLNPGRRSYQVSVQFPSTLGVQSGSVVRYRGAAVGRVMSIAPTTNTVEVRIEIADANLLIPKASEISTNQSGLIGESTIEIKPTQILTEEQLALSPIRADCDASVIICDGDLLQGEVGISYESLLRSAEELADALADPEFVNDLKITLNNATTLTADATKLVNDLRGLSQAVQDEVNPLAVSLRRATDNASDAVAQFELTATEVNSLLMNNRSKIIAILDNVNRSSAYLEDILANFAPMMQEGQLLDDLAVLSANAAEAAVNLQEITGAVNTPENLILLQQTLESARTVFQNAQKIMADVDELTGDPAFRTNLRNLINGLSGLVSTTQLLEQEVQVAQALNYGLHTRSRVVLTPVFEGMPSNPAAPLLTYNGQRYRLELARP